MKTIPSVSNHIVTLPRASGDIDIELAPLPIGFQSMLDAAYPPPVIFVNRQPVPDEARMAEYRELHAFVLLAASIVGEYALDAARPTGKTDRKSWEDFARAVQEELNAAGMCSGDLMALMTGYVEVNQGRGLGKAPSSGTRAG